MPRAVRPGLLAIYRQTSLHSEQCRRISSIAGLGGSAGRVGGM